MGAAYKIIPGIVKLLSHSGQVRAYSFTVKDLAENEIYLKPSIIITGGRKISSLAFSHASYSYNQQPLLRELSFSLKAGEFAGISGLSGSGKTTLLNLLLGFIDTEQGTILINDKKTSAAEREAYRHCIAYVKQQPFLIHDTIRANITLDDDKYDVARLDAVLQATGLKPLLDQYPEGIQQLVTENGKNISGGQRQRIVIARALYKQADLVILDEPFNELDRESENAMLQYFRQMAKEGKMVILITHNKESFSYCDQIISLDEK